MPTTLTQDQLTRAIADMGRSYAAILYGAGASKTSLVPLAWEIVIDLCRDSYCEASGIPVANRDHVRASDVREWLQMQDWYQECLLALISRDRGLSGRTSGAVASEPAGPRFMLKEPTGTCDTVSLPVPACRGIGKGEGATAVGRARAVESALRTALGASTVMGRPLPSAVRRTRS